MLHVRRGADDDADRGRSPLGHDPYGATIEAWTQVEVDRLDAAPRRAARGRPRRRRRRRAPGGRRLRSRCATGCWSLAAHDPLLEWLANGNFVFLGAATYDLASGVGRVPRRQRARPAHRRRRRSTPRSCSTGARCRSPAPSTRLDDPSPGAPDRGDGAVLATRRVEPVAERFVGLLASTAYRQSVLDDPDGRRPRPRGARPRRRRGRDPHRPVDAQRARDPAARPRVRARLATGSPSS